MAAAGGCTNAPTAEPGMRSCATGSTSNGGCPRSSLSSKLASSANAAKKGRPLRVAVRRRFSDLDVKWLTSLLCVRWPQRGKIINPSKKGRRPGEEHIGAYTPARRISLLYAAGGGRVPAEEGVSPRKTMGRALGEEPSCCPCRCGCRTKMASSNLCTSCGHRVCCEVCAGGEACENTVRLCHVCSGEQAGPFSGADATRSTVPQDDSRSASTSVLAKRPLSPPPAPPILVDYRHGRRGALPRARRDSTCAPCPYCGRECVGKSCALKGEYCTCSVPHQWRSQWSQGPQGQPKLTYAVGSGGPHGVGHTPCQKGSSNDPLRADESRCEFCIARAQATCHQCSRSVCHLHARNEQDQGIVCYECFRPLPKCCREDNSAEEEDMVEEESTQTLGMQRGQCQELCQKEGNGEANPEVVSQCGRRCCLRPGHDGDHKCYQCWIERLNAGCRKTAVTQHSAEEQGGKVSERRSTAQEERVKVMQTAKEYLDSSSFRQCCWEILVFRMMREAAETAMGLIIWGQLSCNLVEMCRFPTTLARIHALHEAVTPAYRDHYDDVDDFEEDEDRVSTAVWAQTGPGGSQAPAGSQSRCDAELCWHCSRLRRRTCFRCNAGLCRAHARSRYRFSLYLTAALCPPCARQVTVSSESGESDGTTSTEGNSQSGSRLDLTMELGDIMKEMGNGAEREEQKEPVLDFRRARGAVPEGAEEPRPLASAQTEAAETRASVAVNGEENAQGGETVADPLSEEMDLQVSFDTADSILASLVESQARARSTDADAWGDREFFLDGSAWRDGAFHPDDAPIPSTPHWSRWWRCEICRRWELDLERCLECRRWVCPMRCWPGNGTRCWNCLPNTPRLVPGRRSG